jgi:arginine decarboxylase
MGFLDVGGGLGIDYDGSRTATTASTNYSLQNYANDVVATVRECCENGGVVVPTLVSESGRAIASHFSVLVFDVLGCSQPPAWTSTAGPPANGDDPLIVRNLHDTLSHLSSLEVGDLSRPISCEHLQESWNDAIKFKDDALTAFRLGYMGLRERAQAEGLYWACAMAIARRLADLADDTPVPDELRGLRAALASTYYANLSVFRSAPDTWAIQQLFPVLPIHRLEERPDRLGHFADLTCDSDGKLARFIGPGGEKTLLELHDLRPGEPYWVGLFLAGAYQEVMGNLHNLFGRTNAVHIRLTPGGGYRVDHVVRADTNAAVLQEVEHDPEDIKERLRQASEEAIAAGRLTIDAARRLTQHLEASLGQTTYLEG